MMSIRSTIRWQFTAQMPNAVALVSECGVAGIGNPFGYPLNKRDSQAGFLTEGDLG